MHYKLIKGKNIENIDILSLKSPNLVLDIGCGDGKFIYNYAKNNPECFCIGIDSDSSKLAEISLKIYKKESRGGLNNCIYLCHNIENSIPELTNLCSRIFILFPWGSLVQGIIGRNNNILSNILSLLSPNAQITIVTSYNERFEKEYMIDNNLPSIFDLDTQKNIINLFEKHNVSLQISELQREENIIYATSWNKKTNSQRSRASIKLEGIRTE